MKGNWESRWLRLRSLGRALAARRWSQLLSLREQLRVSENTLHLALAVLVGIGAGVTNLLFFLALEWVKWVVLQRPGDPVEIAECLQWWGRWLAPTMGGLAAGYVLHFGLRLAGRRESTNLLEVVVAGDGRLPFRSCAVMALSSLISLGTGASIGREGCITQLSATLASQGGQRLGWPPYRLRLLVACGAAAGMAAAYNAPIAGAIFAAQIVLGNFAMNLFAPLVCASVVAAVVSRSFFGIEAWYQLPDFAFTNVLQLPWFVVLGGLSGVLGALFLKLLGQSEAAFRRTSLPVYGRLALAGLLVGALAIGFPEIWGNGYTVTSRILGGEAAYGLWFLTGLLATKLLAVVLTVGAGTVGGVFTPTLFLGAALGSIFGHLLHASGTALPLSTGVFALVGMGSVLAATTHSPLLAMIMVFEISLNYSLMPALMLACVVGTLVGRRLHPVSIYTEPLRRRGLLFDPESERLGAAVERTVGDLMHAPIPPLRENTTLREMGNRFLASSSNFLPVVDTQGRLIGVVALQDLKAHLQAGEELNVVIALDVMRPPPPCLTPSLRLEEALPVLLASDSRNVPVVNNTTERRLVGALARSDALGLVAEAIAVRQATRS